MVTETDGSWWGTDIQRHRETVGRVHSRTVSGHLKVVCSGRPKSS